MAVVDSGKHTAWFVTGSQHLYGEEALERVARDARVIVGELNEDERIPVEVVCKPVLTTPEAIEELCREAGADDGCIGLITWMHTFSPARMWIAGLRGLQRPFVHLHTQFNRDIPWDDIDMDFMNLNQSAHGGREFGFMASRLGLERKVITGHWRDERVIGELADWIRAARAWRDSQGSRVARFGDNMRQVAVTEGDKVEAQIRFGYRVNGYGLGDLAGYVRGVSDREVDLLIDEYTDRYLVAPELAPGGERHRELRTAARIEQGMRNFLTEGDFKAFTTTFENLHGLEQLPGLAVQRLMAEGYGFGAEGDWKTAALVRAMKVMSEGLEGGTSFMEDYTYHLEPGRMRVLGAHMLEVCESIAGGRPSLEIHPLDIGDRSDPVRLVFDVASGPGINATIVDLGDRFRMLINEVEVTAPDEELPRLPVARALWRPKPDLPTAASAWILGGGAHHTGFSQVLRAEHLADFAEMAGIEALRIDDETELDEFKKELRWNQAYYRGRGR